MACWNIASDNKPEKASVLGIQEFDSEDSLSEKINLPSSVNIRHRSDTVDRVIIRIKDDFDISKPAFLDLLKDFLTKFHK